MNITITTELFGAEATRMHTKMHMINIVRFQENINFGKMTPFLG